ncbi:MAG TPA: luciferase family protein [Chthoniobacteraceae bacterium]|nr:luciferase family protein [Chthoniobacteraceae bacterium]
MFRFVTRHLHWLSRVPGFPLLFDAMLLAWTAVMRRPCLAAMEAVEAGALAMPGVRVGVHRYGGTEFILAGRELGHMHGNGLLDVRVGAIEARRLVREGRAEPHHLFGESAWVSFWMRTPRDAATAMELLGVAIGQA